MIFNQRKISDYSVFGILWIFSLLLACGSVVDDEEDVETRTIKRALKEPIDGCGLDPYEVYPDESHPYEKSYESYDTYDTSNACCGNRICEENEWSTCPQDCPRCGDGTCNNGETATSCSADCGTCGNNVCDSAETADSCPTDCALPTVVRLDRVRHCRRNWGLCDSRVSFPEFLFWDFAGVSKNHQKKTYLTRLSEPPKSQVKHLVFVSAGQQNSQDDDEASRLTGQWHGYKNSFHRQDAWRLSFITPGLAHEAVERMGWPIHETYVGLAFDARFNFEFSQNEKNDIVAAHFYWLSSKFDIENIESIYLAGHSRGGCLVARLGALFTANFPDIPVIVHSFDGVCTHYGNSLNLAQEFGVSGQTINNPTGSGGFAFSVDLNSQYPNRDNLAFFNQISGGRIFFGARAFSHSEATDMLFSTPGPRPWLQQQWWWASHTNMDTWPVRAAALGHLAEQCSVLGC